jgi:hypothetical protein
MDMTGVYLSKKLFDDGKETNFESNIMNHTKK